MRTPADANALAIAVQCAERDPERVSQFEPIHIADIVTKCESDRVPINVTDGLTQREPNDQPEHGSFGKSVGKSVGGPIEEPLTITNHEPEQKSFGGAVGVPFVESVSDSKLESERVAVDVTD